MHDNIIKIPNVTQYYFAGMHEEVKSTKSNFTGRSRYLTLSTIIFYNNETNMFQKFRCQIINRKTKV